MWEDLVLKNWKDLYLKGDVKALPERKSKGHVEKFGGAAMSED